VVALLLVAAALRIHALGRWSLDGDEIYSWYDVQSLLAGAPWPFGARSHPLGYLLMAASAHLLGFSEFSLRLPSAVCGLAAVALLLCLRRDALPRGVAWSAATLAACSPWLLYDAQNARFYAPQLLCATAATLWALPGVGCRPRLATAAWLGAVLCHPTGLLLGPALVAPLLLPPVRWRPVGGAAAAVGAGLALLWLLDDGALHEVILRVVERRDPGRYDVVHFVAGLGYNLGPLVGLLALLGLPGAWRAPRAHGATLWVACVVCPAVLLLVGLAGISMHQRYATPLLPAMLLLAGWGWEAARRRSVALAGGLLALALLAYAPMLAAHLRDGNRHDVRALAGWFLEHAGPGDIVLVDEHAAFDLYLSRQAGSSDRFSIEEAPPPADHALASFLGNRREVWVAVKTSRLGGGAYGTEFTTWLSTYFTETATVGLAPPALVRHDNRYRIFKRTQRILKVPPAEPSPTTSPGNGRR